ncbi:MAG: hypothetical protein Q8O19_07810, partial [Rectinemataceae bacterium]|nr:hypothetical protein [Rectinemataceae bacterium]
DGTETIDEKADVPVPVRDDAVETATPAPAPAEAALNTAQPAAPVENAPSVPVAPEAVQPVEPIVATIEAGEGFNKLFVDLRESVDTRFHGMQDTSSPVMKYLFETSPTALSDRIGAFDPKTGESMIMQVGDKLYLDDKGDLYFERPGQEAQLIMQNDPSSPDGFKVQELKDVELLRNETPTSEGTKQPSPAEEATLPVTNANPAEAPQEVENNSQAVGAVEAPGDALPQAEDTGHIRLGDYIENSNASPAANAQLAENPPEAADLPGRMTLGDYIAAPDNQSEGTEASVEVSTNENGIEVNSEEPGKYQWKAPGTDTTYTVVYGGSPEETRAWIERELELNPTARILVNESYVNPDTGTAAVRVNEWHLNQEGSVVVEEGIKNSATGAALPPITEGALIRKLS